MAVISNDRPPGSVSSLPVFGGGRQYLGEVLSLSVPMAVTDLAECIGAVGATREQLLHGRPYHSAERATVGLTTVARLAGI
jgi:hypothetical protein